ncbi:MAG: hypothetical protein WC776_05135, partial [Patescibacteria group bacterium]
MKKFISALVMASTLVGAAPVFASTSVDDGVIQARLNSMMAAVNAHQVEQVSVYSERYEKSVSEVMRLNGITRTAAIDRIAHALFSVSGSVPKPQIKSAQVAYNPATHAFQDIYGYQFYAGVDSSGHEQFTATKRGEMGDNFWYCGTGLTFTHEGATSSC